MVEINLKWGFFVGLFITLGKIRLGYIGLLLDPQGCGPSWTNLTVGYIYFLRLTDILGYKLIWQLFYITILKNEAKRFKCIN